MGYMHINNLYKQQEILGFRECYALEKIHGTSAHIVYFPENEESKAFLKFFGGEVKESTFKALFDKEELLRKFQTLGFGENTVVYGEAYGPILKMGDVYGRQIKFVAFDVKVGENWLDVPNANDVCQQLGLEFVDWVRIPATTADIDKERDKPSTQAKRNGMGEQEREGVVLRPLVEYRKNNGDRIISKHKREKFRETTGPRPISDEQLKVLSDAQEVAKEWVTEMRLTHVLAKIEEPSLSKMPIIIRAMLEDVQREGEGEIVWSKEVEKAIGAKTASLVKDRFAATV